MQEDPQSQKTKGPRIPWGWWLILLGLVAWNLVLIWPKEQSNVELPYTAMLAQVDAGNVQSVIIDGDKISGVLKKPIQAPPPIATPGASGTGSVNLAPAGSNGSPAGSSTAAPQTYTVFVTYFPSTVGDPGLISRLENQNVQVNVTPSSSPILAIILSNGLPILLLVGLLVWMGRNASQNQSGFFNFSRSKAREYHGDMTNVTFSDVAGAEEAKTELQEVVDFLSNPKKYHDLGARIPRGVLLVGPPGTGKTLMARAIAGEAGVPFFLISASEFVEMFVGVGASRVRDLFEKAKKVAPAIVFIDEMDAVGRRRGAGLGNVNDEREQTLNQLLVEMDGFDEHHELIVIAATNRPDVLDPALLRPGRFDRQITVGLPDRRGREGILRIHTRQLNLAPEVDLKLLAGSTTGFSGADLSNLCNEAALIAARANHQKVSMQDFEDAIDRVLLGAARTLLLNDRDRRVIAYHEGGHALVAWLTPAADPVHKVTIIPRGRALGVTEQVPGEDRYNYSKEYLLARLAVMLGGRTAEEIALNEITTGAENDLIEATRLARRMITRWGMGALGLMALASDEQQPFLGYELTQSRDYSEMTAGRIDEDIQRLLEESQVNVRQIITENRDRLDQIVARLLSDETLDETDLLEILGPRNLEASFPAEAMQEFKPESAARP
jgi:cell division protease FtsH